VEIALECLWLKKDSVRLMINGTTFLIQDLYYVFEAIVGIKFSHS